MSKYDPLRRHLEGFEFEIWAAKFGEIEAILGFRLPPSARKHQAWWANDPHHVHASAWLDGGWQTRDLDLGSQRITFRRLLSQLSPRVATVIAKPLRSTDTAAYDWDRSDPLECRMGMKWQPIGRVTLGGDRSLTFPTAPPVPAIYRFRIRSGAGEAFYIGETENLARRFTHYRNPGPTQQTNQRLNAKFREELTAGAEIAVAVVTGEAWIEHGDVRQVADLGSKAVRCLFENAALVEQGGTAVERLNR
jgi:hypothetical protein